MSAATSFTAGWTCTGLAGITSRWSLPAAEITGTSTQVSQCAPFSTCRIMVDDRDEDTRDVDVSAHTPRYAISNCTRPSRSKHKTRPCATGEAPRSQTPISSADVKILQTDETMNSSPCTSKDLTNRDNVLSTCHIPPISPDGILELAAEPTMTTTRATSPYPVRRSASAWPFRTWGWVKQAILNFTPKMLGRSWNRSTKTPYLRTLNSSYDDLRLNCRESLVHRRDRNNRLAPSCLLADMSCMSSYHRQPIQQDRRLTSRSGVFLKNVALCVPHFLKNMCTMAYHVVQS